jgi:tRNA nucleotidyltransferase (CCA-adding enzyme)
MPTKPYPAFLKPLVEALGQRGQSVYLVGGAVRNALLGLPDSDFDLCGAILADAMVAIAEAAGYQANIRSCELGTVDIINRDGRAEYTPFRIERYAPGGAHRPDFVEFTVDIGADALRRDFTVNALYKNMATGEIADPLGGLEDLRAKRLRACGKTASDTLKDDGLRILRMARFCAELGFAPEKALCDAAHAHAHNLRAISPSRIFGEWQRLCLCDMKYPGFAPDCDKPMIAITLLDQSGALRMLMPVLYDGVGVAQDEKVHRFDVFGHSLHAFAAAPPDVALRTAALLHDIGKPSALGKCGRMYDHQYESVALARPILDILGVPMSLQKEILPLISRHMFDMDGRAKESTVRVRFATWGFDFAEKLIKLRLCDAVGSGLPPRMGTIEKWRRILAQMKREGAIDDPRMLAIDGYDIQQVCRLGPGAHVGRIKALLFERCAQNPNLNRRGVLLSEAASLCRQLGISES